MNLKYQLKEWNTKKKQNIYILKHAKLFDLKINKNNYIDDPATLNLITLPHFTLIESLNLMSI
jgi:hypothetical protein